MKRAHLMSSCTLCTGSQPSISRLFCTDSFCSSKVSQGQIIDESFVNLLVLYRVEECMKAKQDNFTEVENLQSTVPVTISFVTDHAPGRSCGWKQISTCQI